MSKSVFGFLSSANLVSLTATGEVDWDTTLTAIQGKVETEIAESAERDAVIEAALFGIFDKLPPGGSLPRPLAVSLAVNEVVGSGGGILAMTEYTNHVNDYLDRTTKFVGKRGRNGGLFRA